MAEQKTSLAQNLSHKLTNFLQSNTTNPEISISLPNQQNNNYFCAIQVNGNDDLSFTTSFLQTHDIEYQTVENLAPNYDHMITFYLSNSKLIELLAGIDEKAKLSHR